MSGGVENIHNRVLDKVREIQRPMEILREVMEQLGRAAPSGVYPMIVLAEADDVRQEYLLDVADILAAHYGESAAAADFDAYCRAVHSGGYVLRVNNIVERCVLYAERILAVVADGESAGKVRDVLKQLDSIRRISIDLDADPVDYKRCPECDEIMKVNTELSELQCTCGLTCKVAGVIFRDDQFYSQEGQKSKHGSYDPARHFKFWMDRIQGIEATAKNIPAGDMAQIEAALNEDRPDWFSLSVHTVRAVLKRLRMTKYNNHAVSIAMHFGGAAPPRLSFEEYRQLGITFRKVMALYESVTPEGGNKPYYPYFIYKIIEQEFRHKPEKLALLGYIHLQSRDTIIKNDKIYKKICEIGPNMVYRPTDRRGHCD